MHPWPLSLLPESFLSCQWIQFTSPQTPKAIQPVQACPLSPVSMLPPDTGLSHFDVPRWSLCLSLIPSSLPSRPLPECLLLPLKSWWLWIPCRIKTLPRIWNLRNLASFNPFYPWRTSLLCFTSHRSGHHACGRWVRRPSPPPLLLLKFTQSLPSLGTFSESPSWCNIPCEFFSPTLVRYILPDTVNLSASSGRQAPWEQGHCCFPVYSALGLLLATLKISWMNETSFPPPRKVCGKKIYELWIHIFFYSDKAFINTPQAN